MMFFPYVARSTQPNHLELESGFATSGASEISARDLEGVSYDIDVAAGTPLRLDCDGMKRDFRWAMVSVDYQPASWQLVAFDGELRRFVFLDDDEDERPRYSWEIQEHHVHPL